MDFHPQKIEELLARPFFLPASGELWREGKVFFLGEDLPLRDTLEKIYDSDQGSPVELFFFAFSGADAFRRAEEMVRSIKKNFRGYLLGSFAVPPSAPVLEQAYAAGLDLVDITLAADSEAEEELRLTSLAAARTVFPRWSVLSTFSAGALTAEAAAARIDMLLAHNVVPLPIIDRNTVSNADLQRLFQHLRHAWQRQQVVLQPLRALLPLRTPLAPLARTGFARMTEMLADLRLRTASDIRRLLRVREHKEHLESA